MTSCTSKRLTTGALAGSFLFVLAGCTAFSEDLKERIPSATTEDDVEADETAESDADMDADASAETSEMSESDADEEGDDDSSDEAAPDASAGDETDGDSAEVATDVGASPETPVESEGVDAGSQADAGNDEASEGAVVVADFCVPEEDVPVLQPSHEFIQLDTRSATNDFADVSSCGLDRDLSTPDAFFALDMLAGERWHVRVKEVPGRDVALYVLPECDPRTCEAVADHCPAGAPEHFDFMATTDGRRLIGIDGITDPEVGMEVIVMRPVCGDGQRVHSEACDDGNTQDGDGCDADCRIELEGTAAAEVEPNDAVHAANILPPGVEEFVVSGAVGGTCDMDVFGFSREAGQPVRIEMTNAFGLPCEDAPPITARMFAPEALLVAEQMSAGGTCPTLEIPAELVDAIDGGAFTVSVMAESGADLFDYQLHLSTAVAPE